MAVAKAGYDEPPRQASTPSLIQFGVRAMPGQKFLPCNLDRWTSLDGRTAAAGPGYSGTRPT